MIYSIHSNCDTNLNVTEQFDPEGLSLQLMQTSAAAWVGDITLSAEGSNTYTMKRGTFVLGVVISPPLSQSYFAGPDIRCVVKICGGLILLLPGTRQKMRRVVHPTPAIKLFSKPHFTSMLAVYKV